MHSNTELKVLLFIHLTQNSVCPISDMVNLNEPSGSLRYAGPGQLLGPGVKTKQGEMVIISHDSARC